MSVISAILIGLVMGAVFGLALEKSRVFEPGMIVGQMQFKNFIMLKVFLSAIATSALVLAVLNGMGLVTLSPKATYYGGVLVGGLMLGCGISLAGACPGTVLAQVGVGYRDALFTLVGALVGATVYGYMEPAVKVALLSEGPGKITIASLTGIAYPVLAVVLALICIVLVVLLEKWRPSAGELGRDVDGDF
ncbi:YeeE/YedE thiosulfate transporter family protein [Emcibacter sp.]|uniref:YeeE/YedE thiosulfate transporter family protein n=1 Tax=Emcibacter sp. TaxID=1979954 RepID=UPI003A8D36D4